MIALLRSFTDCTLNFTADPAGYGDVEDFVLSLCRDYGLPLPEWEGNNDTNRLTALFPEDTIKEDGPHATFLESRVGKDLHQKKRKRKVAKP